MKILKKLFIKIDEKSLFIFLTGFASCLAVFAILYVSGKQTIKDSIQVRPTEKHYIFINPLLECEIGASISDELKSFKTSLLSYTEKTKEDENVDFISVYFRDLNNGPWFGINETEKFVPASLIKVPIAMSYFKRSESENILNKKITFKNPINLGDPYFKYDYIKPGKEYTVEKLIESMIKSSDNEATNLLVKDVKPNQIEDVFSYLGVSLPVGELVVSVKQYSTFFRILFNASYLNHENSEKMLSLLNDVKFDKGLRAGVPSEINVSHKFGESLNPINKAKQLHDCGIVYYPNRPYLLCLMTRGNDYDKLASAIADISKFVYTEVDRQQSEK